MASVSDAIGRLLQLNDDLELNLLQHLFQSEEYSDSGDVETNFSSVRHVGISCDACQKRDIKGVRFKCG